MENLQNNQTKICTKCKMEKSVDEFNKRKDSKDGYRNECKQCKSKYQKEQYEENKEEIGKKLKKYYKENKEEIIKQHKEYVEKNKEKYSEYKAKYKENNKEKIAISKKQHYEKNKEHLLERSREYKQSEKGKVVRINSNHKRRAITKQGDVTTEQLIKLKNNSKTCYWCGCSLKGVKINIDHYIPLSLGGEHTISNLVISCQPCNLQKSNKLPHEFALSLGKLL